MPIIMDSGIGATMDEVVVRLLQSSEGNETDSADDVGLTCEELSNSTDGRDLRDTLRLYGTIFVVIVLFFCWLRRRFPNVYNLRNTVDDLKTDLAEDPRGTFGWIWKLFGVTDTEMLNECGMDAICYVRVLEFGAKISLVGILNALWLVPVYATAESGELTDCISDPLLTISISHLPPGSYRFCATVVAAYTIFGFAMYQVLQEFDWFIRLRHRFLAKTLPRNYCVYVQNIPVEYQTDAKLLKFFQEASAQGAVLDAHMAVKLPNLKKLVAKREAVVAKLEHAINIEDVQGVTPTTRTVGLIGEARSVIGEGYKELSELNTEISQIIDRIERKAKGLPSLDEQQEFSEYPSLMLSASDNLGDDVSRMTNGSFEKLYTENETTMTEYDDKPDSPENQKQKTFFNPAKAFKNAANAAGNVAGNVANAAGNVAGNVVNVAGDVAGNVANVAVNLLSKEDGEPHSAGFITFRSLRSAQAALQMIQFGEPFAMEVLEAPDPDDIFWQNVGKTHKELQLGKLLSFGLTSALCLFWTIPMGFIATLSEIDGLRGEVDFIDDLLTKYPSLVPVFAQLAPLLIVVANEVLLIILEALSGLEGPISGAVVQAKLFTKMAAFMIIQTFFVTAIGGSITGELSKMLEQPNLIIDLLANSLPTQSTFYLQILLVDTCLSLGVELLRVSAVGMATIRSCVGPNLTEKERSTTWMGLRPLCDPLEFEHADVLSSTVLYFMVLFVYSALAPITGVFMFVCFIIMGAGYRHQFVYIYPTNPDSGGKLWAAFLKFVPIGMLIAQFTIVGMLALKKAALASAMMFPLLIITILFTVYIGQKHFAMTEFLPSKDAFAVDFKNNAEAEMDMEFVKDKYIQPELREREVFPENTTVEREIEQGCVAFETPPGSVIDGESDDLKE